MNENDRVKLLFGPYQMPKCRIGGNLRCAMRGKVMVRSITEAPISWPATWTRNRRPSLILCGDLARAVEKESCTAVAHWWDVHILTVGKWRRALGVGPITLGTSALKSRWTPETINSESAMRKVVAATQRPERNSKIAAALKGKRRPARTIEAIRKANVGQKRSVESRQRMSEAAKRRGAWPPRAGPPWTAEEDKLLGTMRDADVAERIGRSADAVKMRRRSLRIPAFKVPKSAFRER